MGYLLRVIIILLGIFLSLNMGVNTSWAGKKINYFQSLQNQLIKDGFDAKTIRSFYALRGVRFETKSISSYFVHNESKLNYDQFLKPQTIQKAKNYMAAHADWMSKAEKAYGVHRQVITAILLVETRLGTYVGSRPVLNILSTMAALSDKNARSNMWNYVAGTTHLSRSQFDAKANQKSGWAYRELKAFLTYALKEKLNPPEIIGSYAGAMGFCQFMPSNISILAKDGNGDGRINLFTHADAIMSIASYLNNYGWHSKVNRKQAYDAVYHYNHSQYYVNTVLKIADRLKG